MLPERINKLILQRKLNEMRKLFLLVTCTISLHTSAQTFNSIAITAGVTAANQKFIFKNPDAVSKKNYVFGYNASIFGEFFTRDYVRWVTEIQYNQKGSVDKEPEANYSNKLQYLSWNNYIKIRYEMYSIIPYVLVGPRLEYNLIQSTESPVIVRHFLPFYVNPAVGAGLEFVNYYNIKFFVEAFYNSDIKQMPGYISPELNVLNKDFELRVGLKYEFAKRKESCNTPTYVE